MNFLMTNNVYIRNRWHVLGWMMVLWGVGCDLNRPVEIDLPPYEPVAVVECYLQPGQPYVLTLANSLAYFEPVELNFIRDANVQIRHNGESIPLVPFSFGIEDSLPGTNLLGSIVSDSITVYLSPQIVPEDYENPFELIITGPNGLSITAETMIPTPVPIDSQVVKFDDKDSLALVFTHFSDDPSTDNYYRRILFLNSTDSLPEQDFPADDQFVEGEVFTFGTSFDYERGDTLIANLYHITEDYYTFLLTVDAAITANFSPFAQPSAIVSNVEGGIGIFTGINLDQAISVIE